MIAEANGRRIAYDERGDGRAVLFLHGFPHDRTLWTPQLQSLGMRAHTIAMDLRGLGESQAGGPYTMDAYADDAVALLDHLGEPHATVVGLSMGGYAALALWRRHPARVRSLVLTSTRATADDDATRARREEMIRRLTSGGSEAIADDQLAGSLGRTTRRTRPELVRGVRTMLASAPAAGARGALEAMLARPDSTPTLATITVPTLVLVGDEDVVTPERDARYMHERIPGSRLEVICNAGHVCNIERPAAFNHVLGEHLAALS